MRLIALIFPLVLAAGAEGPPADPATAPADRPPLFLALRLHVLEAPGVPLVHCELSDAELERRVAGVRRIWRQAGVEVYVESRRREAPANAERFQLLAALGGVRLDAYEQLVPAGTRSEAALDVYFVKELPVNGVYFLETRCVFVKESPTLQPVEGGTDYPPERVLSHEIGHHLGLEHVQDRSLLMARGTTGFRIDDEQARRARETAAKRPAVLTAEGILERAEAEARAGEPAPARARLECLGASDCPMAVKERAAALLKTLPAAAERKAKV